MKVEKNIIINRPIESVFSFVTDMHSVPLWAPIKSIRALAEGEPQVGSAYVQTVDVMGQQLEVTIEITEFQPSSSFAFKTISGPLPLESQFTLIPLDGNTRTNLALVGEGEPGGAFKFAGPFLNGMVKKQIDDQLTALKRILEAL